ALACWAASPRLTPARSSPRQARLPTCKSSRRPRAQVPLGECWLLIPSPANETRTGGRYGLMSRRASDPEILRGIIPSYYQLQSALLGLACMFLKVLFGNLDPLQQGVAVLSQVFGCHTVAGEIVGQVANSCIRKPFFHAIEAFEPGRGDQLCLPVG